MAILRVGNAQVTNPSFGALLLLHVVVCVVFFMQDLLVHMYSGSWVLWHSSDHLCFG